MKKNEIVNNLLLKDIKNKDILGIMGKDNLSVEDKEQICRTLRARRRHLKQKLLITEK